MRLLKKIRNYYLYCGIEKDEYNALKKYAYISNFNVWNILHYLMSAIFGMLFITSLFSDTMSINRAFYFYAMIYSVIACVSFSILKKDSLAGQLLIYLSISLLFLFGCLITLNKPDTNATTFIAFLLITPMLMIDKPFFMTIELICASVVFLVWTHGVKQYDVWYFDLINVITFTVVGIFLNIIANCVRIKEFVLTREINIQKDTDELTGLRNKGALTREINDFLTDSSHGRGIMFLLDADRFKTINDTYGHDIGDSVIIQIGRFLDKYFSGDEITGRFGGDEFIVFIKNTDDPDTAGRIAEDVISGVSENVMLPDREQKVSISMGISFCSGSEKNYSEVFKKADTALYRAKANPDKRFCVYE